MGKLSQIRELTKEAKELAHTFQTELNEAIEECNLRIEELDLLKEAIETTTFPQSDEIFEKMANAPEVTSEPVVEVEDGATLQKFTPQEPLEIKEPKTGTFAAKFWGVVVALVLFGLFGVIGAFMEHASLSQLDMQSFLNAFGFYSDLLTGSKGAAPALGIGLAGIISLLIGYGVYRALLVKAAASNLQKAQEILESVKSYIEKKTPYMENIKQISSFLKNFVHSLEGGKVLSEEFIARAKRIMFFEGEDFTQLQPSSKKDIEMLQALLRELKLAIKQPLYMKEEKIVPEVAQIAQDVEKSVQEAKGYVYG